MENPALPSRQLLRQVRLRRGTSSDMLARPSLGLLFLLRPLEPCTHQLQTLIGNAKSFRIPASNLVFPYLCNSSRVHSIQWQSLAPNCLPGNCSLLCWDEECCEPRTLLCYRPLSPPFLHSQAPTQGGQNGPLKSQAPGEFQTHARSCCLSNPRCCPAAFFFPLSI